MLQLNLSHHDGREIPQHRQLFAGDGPWFRPEHAHRAEAKPLAGHERRAGIEAHAGIGERAVAVMGILKQIRHHDHVAVARDLSARRLVTGDLLRLNAHPRLEPLTILVRERHGGDRHVEQLARHARDAVERLAGRRIEQAEIAQGAESRFLLLSLRGHCHYFRSKFHAPHTPWRARLEKISSEIVTYETKGWPSRLAEFWPSAERFRKATEPAPVENGALSAYSPSKEISVWHSTPSSARRAQPPRSGRSMTKAAPTTSALNRRTEARGVAEQRGDIAKHDPGLRIIGNRPHETLEIDIGGQSHLGSLHKVRREAHESAIAILKQEAAGQWVAASRSGSGPQPRRVFSGARDRALPAR